MKIRSLPKKITAGFLIILLIVMSFPIRTNAATNFLSSLGGGLVSTVLGCTGATDAISGLFGKLSGGDKESGEKDTGMDAVPTTNSAVASNTGAVKKKESCTDAIAYTLAKTALKSLTESTLNWINSGFQGEPTYVKDPGSFFTSIAEEQLGGFTAKIAFDQALPFGRKIAQKIIGTISGQLAANANYSRNDLLNDGPNYLDMSYEQKFAVIQSDLTALGSWDNYLKVHNLSWANPADAEIAALNIAGAKYNASIAYKDPIRQIEEDLRQSGGFLSLKKCVHPSNYTPPESDTSFTYAEAVAQAQNDPTDSDTIAARNWMEAHTCKQWQTQTPGQAISSQLDINLGSSVRQLELADELNESLSAVFDALLKQLFAKGVASLSGEDANGSNVQEFGGYGSNTGSTTFISTGASGASGDQWYNQNKDFDLLAAIAPNGTFTPDPACQINSAHPSDHVLDPDCVKDGFDSQGIVITLKEYIAIAKETNVVLAEANRWITELDYCTPGPRPDWYNSALQNVQLAIADAENAVNNIEGITTDQEVQNALDPGGTLSGFTDYANDHELLDQKRDAVYPIIRDFSGLEAQNNIYDDVYDKDISVIQNVRNAFMQMLQNTDGRHNGYREWIDLQYTKSIDPYMSGLNILNKKEYGKLNLFRNTIESNIDDSNTLSAFIPRLVLIYNNIINAQTQYGIGTDAYKRYYDNQLRIFASMVTELKNENDIEGTIADLQTAKAETAYIADPTSGLVRQCIDTAPLITNAQNYTRRPLPSDVDRATATDYQAQGWGNYPTFATQKTFLMDGTITAWGDSPFIYQAINLSHFINQCYNGEFTSYWSYNDRIGHSLHFNSSNNYIDHCIDGNWVTDGDRLENHLNVY